MDIKLIDQIEYLLDREKRIQEDGKALDYLTIHFRSEAKIRNAETGRAITALIDGNEVEVVDKVLGKIE